MRDSLFNFPFLTSSIFKVMTEILKEDDLMFPFSVDSCFAFSAFTAFVCFVQEMKKTTKVGVEKDLEVCEGERKIHN